MIMENPPIDRPEKRFGLNKGVKSLLLALLLQGDGTGRDNPLMEPAGSEISDRDVNDEAIRRIVSVLGGDKEAKSLQNGRQAELEADNSAKEKFRKLINEVNISKEDLMSIGLFGDIFNDMQLDEEKLDILDYFKGLYPDESHETLEKMVDLIYRSAEEEYMQLAQESEFEIGEDGVFIYHEGDGALGSIVFERNALDNGYNIRIGQGESRGSRVFLDEKIAEIDSSNLTDLTTIFTSAVLSEYAKKKFVESMGGHEAMRSWALESVK